LELSMSRILKVTLITVLFGLVGLGCINPTDPGFLDDVGDEVRLTDNALVECDPVFYETTSYDNDIRNARIAYHDGESIHLYDYASDTEEIIYTAPGGYTITALTAISIESISYQGLLIALEGNSEAVIIQEDALEFTEIYREVGEEIDHLSCYIDLSDNYYILFEKNGEIYYRDMTDDDMFVNKQYGKSPVFIDNGGTWLSVRDNTDIYIYYIVREMEFPFYSDGSNIDNIAIIVNYICHQYIYYI
jgi:hypothetical protein